MPHASERIPERSRSAPRNDDVQGAFTQDKETVSEVPDDTCRVRSEDRPAFGIRTRLNSCAKTTTT